MAAAIDDYLHDIAATLSSDLEGALNARSLRWIRPPAAEGAVADATFALHLDGTRAQDNSVLLVSNPHFPDAVADSVARARSVVQRLSPTTAEPVLLPRKLGRHGAQSYGLFPRLEPMSGNKFLRLAQKNIAAPRVARWLQDVALQSRQDNLDGAQLDALFHAPLGYLTEDPDIPEPVRRFAQSCLAQLQQAPQRAFTVIEHGDFWTGNVLFQPGALPGITSPFRVIDWGGARMDGYAGIDLLRYCRSCFRPGARNTTTLMTRYLETLNLTHSDAGLYPMAAMGRLGLNLDQFPKERYLALMTDIFDTLRRSGFVAD